MFASIAMTASRTGVNIGIKNNQFTGMSGFVGSNPLVPGWVPEASRRSNCRPSSIRIESRSAGVCLFPFVFVTLGEIQAVGLVFLYEPPPALLGLTIKQAVTVFDKLRVDKSRHVRYRHTSYGMRPSDLPSPGRQRTDALARCARLFDEPRASFVAQSSRAVRVKRAGPALESGALDRGRVEPGLVLPSLQRVY